MLSSDIIQKPLKWPSIYLIQKVKSEMSILIAILMMKKTLSIVCSQRKTNFRFEFEFEFKFKFKNKFGLSLGLSLSLCLCLS